MKLSKLYLILVLILTIPHLTVAQTEIGLKGGVNLSKVSASIDPSPFSLWHDVESYKVGYQFGLYSILKLTNKFHLAPEFLISGKGTYNWAATYVSIPVLMNVRINDKFMIEAGPEVDLLLIDGSFGKKYPFQLWKKGLSLGLDLGAKLQINERMFTSLRYNHGISSVMDDINVTDDYGNIIRKVKVYSRSFQVSIGYKLLTSPSHKE